MDKDFKTFCLSGEFSPNQVTLSGSKLKLQYNDDVVRPLYVNVKPNYTVQLNRSEIQVYLILSKPWFFMSVNSKTLVLRGTPKEVLFEPVVPLSLIHSQDSQFVIFWKHRSPFPRCDHLPISTYLFGQFALVMRGPTYLPTLGDNYDPLSALSIWYLMEA